MLREDTYNARVSVDGVDLGTWDKMSAVEVDSEELTFTPGGLAEPITLGGRRNYGTVTVEKLYTADIHGNYHWLVQRAGKAEMVITRQPLDADGNANGRVVAISGKLKAVNSPEIDSEGDDAALIELEMTVRGIS